jgi:hypothetical protein
MRLADYNLMNRLMAGPSEPSGSGRRVLELFDKWRRIPIPTESKDFAVKAEQRDGFYRALRVFWKEQERIYGFRHGGYLSSKEYHCTKEDIEFDEPTNRDLMNLMVSMPRFVGPMVREVVWHIPTVHLNLEHAGNIAYLGIPAYDIRLLRWSGAMEAIAELCVEIGGRLKPDDGIFSGFYNYQLLRTLRMMEESGATVDWIGIQKRVQIPLPKTPLSFAPIEQQELNEFEKDLLAAGAK